MTAALPPIPDWEFPDLRTWQEKRAAREQVIKPLWDMGFSAGQIAMQFFGASRNAVIGVIHRAKWQRSVPVDRSNVARRPAPNPQKHVAKVKRPPGRPKAECPTIEPERERADWINNERPPLPGTTPVSMLALPYNKGTMCRFSVVGGYCGQPSGDHMYCEPHRVFMYQARPNDE